MTPVLGGDGFAAGAGPGTPQRDDRSNPLPAPARSSRLGPRDLRASLLIGLVCLLVYNANGRAISAGDTYPARYLPFALWRSHSLFLDSVATLAAQGRSATAFWMEPVAGGHTISLYPVVVPVLLAPLYLPAVAYLHRTGWTDVRLDRTARILEKLFASLVTALSASLLYPLLRRRVAPEVALLLTVAYAFGTTTWVVSSQALWQHGLAELLGVGALLLLTGPSSGTRAVAAGLLCGLLAANRPPDLLLGAALGLYGLFWAGRRAPLLAAGAALPMGLALLYNLMAAGHFAGGYGLRGKATFFEHDLLSGLGGLLLSPTRGLLVFSPFLLFLALAGRHRPQDRDERRLGVAIACGVLLQLLLYAKSDWRAGMSWGPRYLTDLLPLLVWLLAPAVAALRGFARTGFLLAVGVAIAIEAIGAFWYTGATDVPILAVRRGPEKMRAAWEWRNAPFLASLRQGPAPAELLLALRGGVDAIETEGRPASSVFAGEPVAVAGWTLAGAATPWQVAVFVDGRPSSTSRTFFDRPDVRAALGEKSPAGWRVPLETAGLAPGEHSLTVLVWASENGEGRFLGERKLTVLRRPPPEAGGDDLEGATRTAVTRLREHQQEPGYWLTSYTKAPRFEEPRPEMNTFLTSFLVDLLGQLEAPGTLEASLRRARRHLTAQIEAGGLVRYHGLPDAPGIGTLGCAITPDTDDTALVWRLAPDPDRRRLPEALKTLERYRTGEGLYRVWLSPREGYQCLDPGSNPNPTDIAIQMHTLLLLARERPEAARALCAALRPVAGEDRIWVYYRWAPLVPMLRLADVRRAGCALELPAPRMRTSVPGQEVWVDLVRLLERAATPGGEPGDAAEIRRVLRQVARDDFALLRTNPPLLYHNDLSASVRRFYWSEDAGYALWLRLAEEEARLRRSRAQG